MNGEGRQKLHFMDGQLFHMTLGAATQRANVYAANTTELQRRAVHKALREALEDLAPGYRSSVTDDVHCRNIAQLAQGLSDRCRPLLLDGKFRIGNAQKALNLYLKYRWCTGRSPEPPPHCPFDALVLKHVPRWRTKSWTKLDSIDRYRDLVAAARKAAEAQGYHSLAVWELHLYNKILERRPGGLKGL